MDSMFFVITTLVSTAVAISDHIAYQHIYHAPMWPCIVFAVPSLAEADALSYQYYNMIASKYKLSPMELPGLGAYVIENSAEIKRHKTAITQSVSPSESRSAYVPNQQLWGTPSAENGFWIITFANGYTFTRAEKTGVMLSLLKNPNYFYGKAARVSLASAEEAERFAYQCYVHRFYARYSAQQYRVPCPSAPLKLGEVFIDPDYLKREEDRVVPDTMKKFREYGLF